LDELGYRRISETAGGIHSSKYRAMSDEKNEQRHPDNGCCGIGQYPLNMVLGPVFRHCPFCHVGRKTETGCAVIVNKVLEKEAAAG
jgi:hypothetical protein